MTGTLPIISTVMVWALLTGHNVIMSAFAPSVFCLGISLLIIGLIETHISLTNDPWLKAQFYPLLFCLILSIIFLVGIICAENGMEPSAERKKIVCLSVTFYTALIYFYCRMIEAKLMQQ